MPRRCTIAGTLLALTVCVRCECGQAAAGDPCDDSAECPAGYACHPDLRLCVRGDGGATARDAARDAGSLTEGGQLDAGASDLRPADSAQVPRDAATPDAAAAPTDARPLDQDPLDSVGAERDSALDGSTAESGAAEAGAAEAGVAEASAADVAAPVDAALPDLTPSVDAARPPITVIVTPRDGATSVAVGTTVQLDFSRPMSTLSVEQGGLCLATLSSGCVAGSFVWQNGASVVFTPTSALTGGAVHVLTVRNACTDADGYAFVGVGGVDCSAPDQCTRFTTNDGVAPSVLSVVPANAASNIALLPSITLTFSEPMDQASVLGHVQAGNGDVSGSWSWSSPVAYRFDPDLAFGCSTQVRVSLDEGARDPSGLALVDSCTSVAGAAFCASFTTRPPHQECHDVQAGTCSDVLTRRESCCSGCMASMGVPCNNVGITYTVSCGTTCPTGCHYERVYDTVRVCENVCS